jgi:hypothetical protein
VSGCKLDITSQTRREGVNIFMASLRRGSHACLLPLGPFDNEATRQPRRRRSALRQPGIVPGHDAVEYSIVRRIDAVRRTINTQLGATWAGGSKMYARPRTWHGLRRRIGSLLKHKALAGLEIDMLDILLSSALAQPSYHRHSYMATATCTKYLICTPPNPSEPPVGA